MNSLNLCYNLCHFHVLARLEGSPVLCGWKNYINASLFRSQIFFPQMHCIFIGWVIMELCHSHQSLPQRQVPSSPCYLLWYTEPELSVMKTACRSSWCSWRTSSNRMATTTGRSTGPSTVVRTYLNRTTSPIQPPSCPLSELYSTVSAECWPDTTSNLWACPTWNYLVSSVRSRTTSD
jgi:hypothetical protein